MVASPHHPRVQNGIFSEESGPVDAPLVVLIHGSLDRSAGMTKIARHLIHRHQTIRYDRRGYGKSWEHEGPFTVSDHVDDMVDLLDGRPAVLFGHSYGGNVALATAERLPNQIRGVSTFETPLSWMPWWPGSTAGAAGIAAGEEQAAEHFMIRLIGQSRWDALPERTKNERRREGRALVNELAALRTSAPWTTERISCPVLCGFGAHGLGHHRQGAEWMADNLGKAHLVEIEGAGHSAPMTHALACVDGLIRPHFSG